MANRFNGEEYGALLRNHRLLRGLTQSELAGMAGVSPRTISDLERGIHKLPFQHTVVAIAAALDLSVAQIDAMRNAIKLSRKSAALASISRVCVQTAASTRQTSDTSRRDEPVKPNLRAVRDESHDSKARLRLPR